LGACEYERQKVSYQRVEEDASRYEVTLLCRSAQF
jgi:hypothetical protein